MKDSVGRVNKTMLDIAVIGGGLAGLAAANEIGERATVLERAQKPGGLVRSEKFGEYWFDHVLHLLYFHDTKTKRRIFNLLGNTLRPCSSNAWVESLSGCVPFPFQMHLAGLPHAVVVNCLSGLAQVAFSEQTFTPSNFEEWLYATFGKGMCDEFLLPYNRKMWQRDLSELVPTNFQWTITHPVFEDVLRGALNRDHDFKSYNDSGWYPCPQQDSSERGIGVLANALASTVSNLHLGCELQAIDLQNRELKFHCVGDNTDHMVFENACITTIPLPKLISICSDAPLELSKACKRLKWNRVRSIAISVKGKRPINRGLWRYYADESLIFTRLIYMHEFDPFSAPKDGWGLLVEVTEKGEEAKQDTQSFLARVLKDIQLAGAIPQECEIIDVNILGAEPAYVVFTPETQDVVSKCREFLESFDVYPLGRYGRWEYSSMSQVMSDGFALGRSLLTKV